MNIKLPATVKLILERLRIEGFEAYAVGGCVRDAILGRVPDDWDITTSARPETVKRIFSRTVDTGIAHGTVTVLMGSAAHEVTTYRVDGTYEDHRHPDHVDFTGELAEDLARRDFTINAMAYDPKEGLVDLYGGMDDLQKKRIRCVGDPEARLAEDALRMLRAVRFSAQLGFSIDAATAEAIRRHAEELKEISAERICTELVKLITSPHPDYLRRAYELGITRVILPEFDAMMETEQNTPYHYLNVGEHTLAAMCALPALEGDDLRILRLTMLLHDIGKPQCRTTDHWGIDHFRKHAAVGEEMAVSIMRRLKMDNDTIAHVRTLIRWHDWRVQPEERLVRRAVAKVGADRFPYLSQVQYADAIAQSNYIKAENLARIEAVHALYEKIMAERQPVGVKDLAVNGGDLIALGCPQGPQIGAILAEMLDAVLEDPAQNQKEVLLAYARRRLEAGDQ